MRSHPKHPLATPLFKTTCLEYKMHIVKILLILPINFKQFFFAIVFMKTGLNMFKYLSENISQNKFRIRLKYEQDLPR